MEFISEQIIDEVAETLNASEHAYEAAVEDLRDQQPVVLAYLFNEELAVFTQPEKEFLLYLVLVIWQSISHGSEQTIPSVTEDLFTEKEENNWEIIQAQGSKSFREKLDVFFDQYPQEDLLAFIEDALVEDEEDEIVTKEGREAMFIILKTIVDCWTAN
ncbi:MAG: hypothetical protein R2828_11620 [Saprospiraceae bacterium]